MSKVTPQEYSEKWARNMKNSAQDIQRGIQGVTESPTAKAAASLDRAAAAYQEAVTSGRMASKLNAVSLQDWKNAAATKTAARLASGVDAAQPKQVQMAGRLLAAVDQAAASANALPKGTLADSINRMTEFVTQMSRSKGQI